MKQKGRSFLFFFLFVFFLFAGSMPSVATPVMPKPKWEELTKDKEFGYRDEKELVKEEPAAHTSVNVFAKAIEAIIRFFGSPAGRALVWMFFFSILGYVIYKVFLKGKLGRGQKKLPDDEEEEIAAVVAEDLFTTNWEEQLEKAIRENNLRLAVRFGYMRLLQLLQEKQLIQYRSDKTNYDYYHELGETEIKTPFRQLSRQYEFAWYGDYAVAPQVFEAYINTFNQLKSRLKRS